jgi:phosphohistidine phosphatase
MTELYVVRHGIALPHGTPGIYDNERPLTEKGRRRMRQISRGLRRLGIEPDGIVSSPLPRAWQTAEIIAEVLGLSSNLEAADELRADRDAAAIRDWILSRPESRLMIVGHDPAFSDLVGLLVTGAPGPQICALEKGGVAALSARAGEKGRFLLDWLATPRLLRRGRGG